MGLLSRLLGRAARSAPTEARTGGLLSKAARSIEYGPFQPPFNNTARVPLRDRFAYSGIEPTTEDDWFDLAARGQGERARVPLRDLFATQDTVASNYSDVARRNADELPMIVEENGHYYILDGHHRLTALQDSGEELADVRLYRSDWRPPPGWKPPGLG